jgi:hypothetical protein
VQIPKVWLSGNESAGAYRHGQQANAWAKVAAYNSPRRARDATNRLGQPASAARASSLRTQSPLRSLARLSMRGSAALNGKAQ